MKEDLMAALIIIVIVVVVVVALVAVGARRRRTALLRDHFGPEYDRAVENSDDQRAAEASLRERERQRAQFDVRPLPEAERLRYAGEWRDLQERFVDQPAEAAAAADTLVTRVMEARGYPMTDFDAQADLVSVDHPGTVEDYRFAHAVQRRSGTEQASTEDLREALLRYRSLFDELLRPEGNGAAGTAEGRRDRVAAQPEARAAEASAAGQPDDPAARGSGSLAGPTVPDADYHDQQIGR